MTWRKRKRRRTQKKWKKQLIRSLIVRVTATAARAATAPVAVKTPKIKAASSLYRTSS